MTIQQRFPGNTIHHTAIIAEGVTMGKGNYIGPYCIIGYPPESRDHFNTVGLVEIGNDNTLTKQVTIDSGTVGLTIVGDNCWMLKNAHVGHDAFIDDYVTLACNAMVGGWSKVRQHSNLGLGAAVHQRVNIPEWVMVGMNSTVTKTTNCQPFTKYAGSPAKAIGDNLQFYYKWLNERPKQ